MEEWGGGGGGGAKVCMNLFAVCIVHYCRDDFQPHISIHVCLSVC